MSTATHATTAAAPPAAAYRARLARGAAALRAAQALRFRVFNLERHEGLAQSYATALDADRFDDVCDHLLVDDAASGEVVGTYRLLGGARAAETGGYYGEREFDFAPYEPLRAQLVELGRACIDARHRHFGVLNLLWNGIAAYAQRHGARWLIGCSSLASQDASVGAAALHLLQPHLAPPPWRTVPRPAFACAPAAAPLPAVELPKLLTTYLALGAWVCAPPAIDREFKTIDLLTLLDLRSPRLRALQRRGHFTGSPC